MPELLFTLWDHKNLIVLEKIDEGERVVEKFEISGFKLL